jgi:effector-binding domain-containing protein
MYDVRLERVAPQTIAVVRETVKQSELSRVVPAGCGEVWHWLKAAGLPRPGRVLAVYLDGAIHLEVGAEVQGPFTGDGRVCCSSTPAGMVAITTHDGPYDRLGQAHEAIHLWCTSQGHEMAGPNWEIYGHWTDDPAQLRTDVYYLLKEAGEPPVTGPASSS